MLQIENLSKTFPGVKALDDVSFTMAAGEVHALLGENGAGKSTLIKIISGLYKPDKGSRIFLEGEPYYAHNTYESLCKGIHTVYQHLSIIPQASVAENIMLDKLPRKGNTGVVDWKAINNTAAKYLDFVGLDIDPATIISKLSIAQRQLVEITKAIASENKILLLDEPTASLTKEEAAHLFKIMNDLKSQGVLIVFVSHILEEVLAVSDKITVLRDGQFVISEDRDKMDRKKIINCMIGREVDLTTHPHTEVNRNNAVLTVRALTLEKKAYDINLSLYEGEILGFYGLVGSGRTELARILIGHDKHEKGEILIKGGKAIIHSIDDALRNYHIGYVTEDRRKEGLILSESVKTNITITVWREIAKLFGYVSNKKENAITHTQIEKLNIKTTGVNQKVGNLSGGNQQKVNVGKWLAADTEILIIDEPTVGVDVGAKQYLESLIVKLAEKGKSIILISSDMPEIIRLAHRILVFSGKRIVGEIDNSEKDYAETSKKISEYISEFRVSSTE